MKLKYILRICLLLTCITSGVQIVRAQQVTRVNPSHITLRGVSLSSLWTGMMVGDSNYVAVTHSAFDLNTSPSFVASQSPFPKSTTLYAVAYAGDTLHAVIAGENGSLAWTSNGGSSWTAVPLGTTATIRAVSWNNSTASPLLVGVGDGGLLIRSTDQGVTWKNITSPTAANLNAVTFGTPSDAVGVGNDTTMIQSHDGGQTWLPMAFPYNFHTWYNGGYENKFGRINFTGVAMAGRDSVWVCFDTAMLPLLVCKGGAADTSKEFLHQLFGDVFGTGNIPVNWPLQTYPKWTSVVYVGMPKVSLISSTVVGDFVYYTVDCDSNIVEKPLGGLGDANGSTVELPLRIRAQGFWKQDTSYIIVLAGDDLSLYQESGSPNNGMGFSRAFPPYPGKDIRDEILAVSILPNGYGYEVATGDYFQRTTDYGRTWTNIPLPLASSPIDNVYTLDSATALVVGWDGVILRYDPSGSHVVPSGTQERLEWISFPSPDTGIIVGDFGTELLSSDRGATWRTVTTPTSVRLFSIAFANNRIGIATGDSGTILRTTDEGVTWTNINNLLSGTSNSILRVQGFSNGVFLAQGGNELLRSTDFGKNWQFVNTPASDTAGMGFYSPQIGMIAEHSTSSQHVPDTARLAFTTNGGSTWTQFAVPFWNDRRILFNWLSDHEVLIYGSYGFIDDVVISSSGVPEITRVQTDPALSVFPNPSSGNISVEYNTLTSGAVAIELLDESGRKVKGLFSGQDTPGQHSRSFSLSELHGAFFLKVISESCQSTAPLWLN